jgi:hypothetical protein
VCLVDRESYIVFTYFIEKPFEIANGKHQVLLLQTQFSGLTVLKLSSTSFLFLIKKNRPIKSALFIRYVVLLVECFSDCEYKTRCSGRVSSSCSTCGHPSCYSKRINMVFWIGYQQKKTLHNNV